MSKIVRIRKIKSAMGFLTLITWGVYEGTSRKPLYKAVTREDAARWVTEQGWRYLGPQERVR